MGEPAHAIPWTHEDYLLFPEDGKRYEIVEGECHMSPAPRTNHQFVSGRLFMRLGLYLEKTKIGKVLSAPTDVILSATNIVQPDLLVVLAARTAIITDGNIQGAPDLVIEILSETTRKTDEMIKKKLYERYGVTEYWIADPELSLVKIYRMTDGRYGRVEERTQERRETLTTALLPGLEISLAEIFA